MDAPGFQRLADIEVDLVKPERDGFTLTGQGADQAQYLLNIHFDIPLDARTRVVLGELLAQSELTIARRPPPLATALSRSDRAHRAPHRRVTAD